MQKPPPHARAVRSLPAVLALIALSPLCLAIAQCEGDDDDSPTPEPIPASAIPCRDADLWPHALESATHPMIVHYHDPSEEALAREVLQLMDQSWTHEIEQLKFRPPLDDQGKCGTDGRFDVFVWKGKNTCYVDVVAENPDTWYDDYSSYLVIDPWGDYGGEILDSTLAHEFNHACQAADDWWDAYIIFEMTSTLIEEAVFDDDNEYRGLLGSFQERPDWGIDRNDNYRTWYMYGAVLYLLYVNDRFYDGDFSFAQEMWLNMRNAPGAAYNQALNEPDFQDALDVMLREKAGVSYMDSVLEFARWRWYTGIRDDGQHFEEGASFPTDAIVASVEVPVGTNDFSPLPSPMLLGNSYLNLSAAPGTTAVTVTLEPGPSRDVDFVVQAVPGLDGTDGEEVAVVNGVARVPLTAEGTRTLIVTAMPAGDYDTDTRTDDTYPFRVSVTP